MKYSIAAFVDCWLVDSIKQLLEYRSILHSYQTDIALNKDNKVEKVIFILMIIILL